MLFARPVNCLLRFLKTRPWHRIQGNWHRKTHGLTLACRWMDSHFRWNKLTQLELPISQASCKRAKEEVICNFVLLCSIASCHIAQVVMSVKTVFSVAHYGFRRFFGVQRFFTPHYGKKPLANGRWQRWAGWNVTNDCMKCEFWKLRQPLTAEQ